MSNYKLWSQGERQDYEYTELEQGNGNGNNGNGKGNNTPAVPLNDWIPFLLGFAFFLYLLNKKLSD